MTRYQVELRFTPNGPATTGTWTVEEPARRTYREWADRYGGRDGISVLLVAVAADGDQTVLARAHGGEAAGAD